MVSGVECTAGHISLGQWYVNMVPLWQLSLTPFSFSLFFFFLSQLLFVINLSASYWDLVYTIWIFWLRITGLLRDFVLSVQRQIQDFLQGQVQRQVPKYCFEGRGGMKWVNVKFPVEHQGIWIVWRGAIDSLSYNSQIIGGLTPNIIIVFRLLLISMKIGSWILGMRMGQLPTPPTPHPPTHPCLRLYVSIAPLRVGQSREGCFYFFYLPGKIFFRRVLFWAVSDFFFSFFCVCL